MSVHLAPRELPSLSPAIRRCAPRHFSVGLALSCPYLNLGGLQLKVNGAGGARCQVYGSWDVLELDLYVPVVEVCP